MSTQIDEQQEIAKRWAVIDERLRTLLDAEWRHGVAYADGVGCQFPAYSEFIDSFMCWVEKEINDRREALYGHSAAQGERK